MQCTYMGLDLESYMAITFTNPALTAQPGQGQRISFSEKYPRLEKLLWNKTQGGFIWQKLIRQAFHILKPKSVVRFA